MKQQLFKHENCEIHLSRYRSINGYTEFFIYDFENNLLSSIMASHSAPIKTHQARIITTHKNFTKVKMEHRRMESLYKPTRIYEAELLAIKKH